MPMLAEALGSLRRLSVTNAAGTQRRLLPGLVARALVLLFLLAQSGSPFAERLRVPSPVAAAEYLRSHPGERLFNEVGYGSYLIWAVPSEKVFVDPRFDLFPLSQWSDYIDVSAGQRIDELLGKYQVDTVLLSRELQP